MYAVINDSGTQFTVKEGDVIRVDLKGKNAGDTIEFSSVALVNKGDALLASENELANAKVVAKVLGETKGPKVITNHFKRKKHSNKTRIGHRQKYTQVKIESINA